MKEADVCSRCKHLEHCNINCEAYMTLARMSINLDTYVRDWYNATDSEHLQTPIEYLSALVDELKGLTEI
jgi:hypothetical protein